MRFQPEVAKLAILAALKKSNGNVSQAARQLKVSRASLHLYLVELKLERGAKS